MFGRRAAAFECRAGVFRKSREGQQNAAYVRLNDAQEQIETGKIEKERKRTGLLDTEFSAVSKFDLLPETSLKAAVRIWQFRRAAIIFVPIAWCRIPAG